MSENMEDELKKFRAHPEAKEGSILAKNYVYNKRDLEAADKKAKLLVEEAGLNKAVRLIETLKKEIEAMVLPARFSKTKMVSENSFFKAEFRHDLGNLNEADFKQQQLLADAKGLQTKIFNAIGDLRSLIMDIEATKQESVSE